MRNTSGGNKLRSHVERVENTHFSLCRVDARHFVMLLAKYTPREVDQNQMKLIWVHASGPVSMWLMSSLPGRQASASFQQLWIELTGALFVVHQISIILHVSILEDVNPQQFGGLRSQVIRKSSRLHLRHARRVSATRSDCLKNKLFNGTSVSRWKCNIILTFYIILVRCVLVLYRHRVLDPHCFAHFRKQLKHFSR